MLQREIVRFRASDTLPNPLEVDYWIDLKTNMYGGAIRYYRNSTNTWELLDAEGDDDKYDEIIDYINNLVSLIKEHIDNRINEVNESIENINNEISNLWLELFDRYEELILMINNNSKRIDILEDKVDDLIDNFYEYLKKYIDNDTIYADDEHRVIKAKGGSGPSTKTFDITVTLSDAEKGSVSITGTEVLKEVATEGKYVYTVGAVSDATIKVTPITGYLILKLIVDGEDKGILSSYTFESINANHSIRVELAQDERYTIPPKWRRSDNQQEYLGIYNATKAVVQDYPDGLTQDIELICIEKGIDYRDNTSQIESNTWNVYLKDWNKNTQFILTINGDNKATLDGRGFGGLKILNCSNIIIKSITFLNFNTYEGVYAPEETACIYVSSLDGNKYRNLYIDDIKIKGLSTHTPTSGFRTRYGITVKGVDNVNIRNVTLTQVVVRPISVVDARIIDIYNVIFNSSTMLAEVIGHPSIMNLLANNIHISDCTIDGSSYNEACLRIDKVKRLYLKRNHIFNCSGPVAYIGNELGIDIISITNNYMHNNVTLPKYQWDCTWFNFGKSTQMLLVSNNTFVFNTSYYLEFFARSGATQVGKFINVNNIYNRTNSLNHGLYALSSILELVCTNNIYNDENWYYSIEDQSSPVKVSGNLEDILSAGYELDSVEIPKGTEILMPDRPCLLPELALLYKCNSNYVEEFDYKYYLNEPNNSSIGCDNYFSTEYDEEQDDTWSYTGLNIYNNDSFSSSSLYSMPAQQELLLTANTKNRNKYIKYTLSKTDTPSDILVSIGRIGLFSILPKLDSNNEYVSDLLYDVTIE